MQRRGAARRAAAIIALAIECSTAGGACAAWRDSEYEYAVVNESLVGVLTNFGYNTGLRMAIDDKVLYIQHDMARNRLRVTVHRREPEDK